MDQSEYIQIRRKAAISMMAGLSVYSSPHNIRREDVEGVVRLATDLANALRFAEKEEASLENVYDNFDRVPFVGPEEPSIAAEDLAEYLRNLEETRDQDE